MACNPNINASRRAFIYLLLSLSLHMFGRLCTSSYILYARLQSLINTTSSTRDPSDRWCYTGPSEGALTSVMSLSAGAFHYFAGWWWQEGGAWSPGGPVSLPNSLTPRAARVGKHERCINIFRTGVPLMNAAERRRKGGHGKWKLTLALACSSDCACCLWWTPGDHGFLSLHCK